MFDLGPGMEGLTSGLGLVFSFALLEAPAASAAPRLRLIDPQTMARILKVHQRGIKARRVSCATVDSTTVENEYRIQ